MTTPSRGTAGRPSASSTTTPKTPAGAQGGGVGGAGDLFVLESFSPAFVSTWERETDICSICRNPVEGSCIICQSDTEATAWECSMVWGVCGHAFHAHCIDRWIKTRGVCPLDNAPWQVKTEWSDVAR